MATSPPANPPPVRTQIQLRVDPPDNEARHQDHRDNRASHRTSDDDHDHDDQERPRRGSAFSYSPIYAPRVLDRMTPDPQAPQPRTTPAPHTDNLRSHISPIRTSNRCKSLWKVP